VYHKAFKLLSVLTKYGIIHYCCKRVQGFVDDLRVSECLGLTSHSTHNGSFRRKFFPGNRLHWYWQPKTRKQKTTYSL